jgi:hypothetical protein
VTLLGAAAGLAALVLAMPAASVPGSHPPPFHPLPYSPLPASVGELPEGPPTAAPWWQDGLLHLGATAIRTLDSSIVSRNGTTVVGRGGHGVGSRSQWRLVVGDQLVPLPSTDRVRKPIVSADGRWVAWLDVRETRLDSGYGVDRDRLVVYDAVQHRVVRSLRDTRHVEWEDGVNGLDLREVNAAGAVMFGWGNKGVYYWAPGHRPQRLRHAPGSGSYSLVDAWPQGLMLRGPGRRDEGALGTVSASGRFHQVDRLREPIGLWSPAGSAFAYKLEGYPLDTFWVDRLADRTSVQLGLPAEEGTTFYPVDWESDDAVVLWLDDEFGQSPISVLVRCQVTTGSCEQVPGGPVAGSRATMSSPY